MSGRRPDLTDLLSAGLPGTGVGFGPTTTPVAAAALADSGQRQFSPTADVGTAAVILTNDQPSVELVLGAILTGSRLVSLPIPSRAADFEAYADTISSSCSSLGAAEVIARDDIAPLLADLGVPTRAHSSLGTGSALRPVAAPSTGGFELIQFSSGSTGPPKAIALDGEVIANNILAIISRLEPRKGDVAVSWLPLSHDMGLIGMLLTAVASMAPDWVGGGEVILLEPEQFLRRPQLWVEALHHLGGTFTAAPTFGYEMATRRAPEAGLRLHAVRCAIVGGDIVRADSLNAFADTFAPCGLNPLALCPAYGMAELGLAATLTPPGVHWRETEVDSAALGEHHRVPPHGDRPSTRLVSSGIPLDGYAVSIAKPVRDIGQIGIVAPACGSDATTGLALADELGLLTTGDVGFIAPGGWVYVCGRNDDYLTANGRNVYAPAIEAAVGQVPGVRHGRTTAVGTPAGEWILVVEAAGELSPAKERWLARDARRAAVTVASAQPSHVVVLGPGQLPMTSSGKVQRAEVRRRWTTGTLDAPS